MSCLSSRVQAMVQYLTLIEEEAETEVQEELDRLYSCLDVDSSSSSSSASSKSKSKKKKDKKSKSKKTKVGTVGLEFEVGSFCLVHVF